jgi:hypothetical protein
MEKSNKMHLQEIKWEGVKWIYLTQDRDRCMEFLYQLSEWLSGGILLYAKLVKTFAYQSTHD